MHRSKMANDEEEEKKIKMIQIQREELMLFFFWDLELGIFEGKLFWWQKKSTDIYIYIFKI